MKWIFLLSLTFLLFSCAPATSTYTTTINLPTCTPPTISQSSTSLSQIVSSLNANENQKLQSLQVILYNIDSNYNCGILLDSDLEKGILVYDVAVNSSSSNHDATIKASLDSLNENSVTFAVLTRSSSGDPSGIYVKRGNSAASNVDLSSEYTPYFSQLGKSNKSIFLGSRSNSTTQSQGSDIYNCSDFSSQTAAQAFFQSSLDDSSRLDADNDGRACEIFETRTFTKYTTTVTKPRTTPYSSSSGKCWVNGYTRKNGTRVSGYYRKC